MRTVFVLLAIVMIMSTANAQYDWKKCANSVIDTLITGLETIQAGINGQAAKAAKLVFTLKNDITATFNQCGQTPTFLGELPTFDDEEVQACVSSAMALFTKINKEIEPKMQQSLQDVYLFAPLYPEFQNVFAVCSNIMAQKNAESQE